MTIVIFMTNTYITLRSIDSRYIERKKSIMKKRTYSLLFILLFIPILFGCSQNNSNHHNLQKSELAKVQAIQENQTLFISKHLWNGDAKFFNDYIITNVNGRLIILNNKGHIEKSYSDIHANWLDTIEQENLIVCSSSDNKTNMIRLDSNLNLLSKTEIFSSDTLNVDPSIIKVKNTYYLTLTTIKGTVNNADKSKKNGTYTVKLYKSTDSIHWTFVTNIVSYPNNIEDVILYYHNKIMYLVFEKETYDKGKSSILIIQSNDYGATWNSEKQLVPSSSDNEPAHFTITEQGPQLYYSSDIKHPGKSYEGASIYVNNYNFSMKKILSHRKPKMNHNPGNLLYDIHRKKGKLYYLFTQKYMTESNLILEKNCN